MWIVCWKHWKNFAPLREIFFLLLMKLYTQTSGTGPDLVLIHGWGLHSGIWDTLLPLLEPHFRITRVDLPGHGRSDWQDTTGLDAFTDAVLANVPEQAAWLGWSLGGLVAAHAAAAVPARVSALVLVASTPSFIHRPDWQSAMQPELLDGFADELETGFERTLNRFLSLQVRGSDNAATALRELRARLLAQGEPDPAALRAGLAILRDTDLRSGYADIKCPALMLMGERDTLVPVSAAQTAAAWLPHGSVHVVNGAGHAPFIASPGEVADTLRDFLLAGSQSLTGDVSG